MQTAAPSPQKSTNGRLLRHGFPRAMRAGMGALEAVAPALAERLAARLFLTPPRHAQPGWERTALREGEPFAVHAGGGVVRGRRLGAGPAVLLVHGWGGRGSQLAMLAPPLVEAGCTAVVFDGPGHGASAGRMTNMVKFAEAVQAVADDVGARAAVGHSFGGAALTLALNRGLALDAAVLVGTPRTPRGFFEPFCAALGVGEASRDGLRRRIERNVGVPMDDLDVPRQASGLGTPALVVHDRTDAEVPFEAGASVAAAWPGARLLQTEGLGHRRILRDAGVAREIASFVVDRLARCGCGRLAVAVADGEGRCETCLLAVHLASVEEREPHAGLYDGPNAILRGRRAGLDEAVDRILAAMERSPGPLAPR